MSGSPGASSQCFLSFYNAVPDRGRLRIHGSRADGPRYATVLDLQFTRESSPLSPCTVFTLSQGHPMDLQPPLVALPEQWACASHMLPQVGEGLENLGHSPPLSIDNTFSCSHGRIKSSRHHHHRLPGCGQDHPRQPHPDRAARQEARRHRERIR